MKKLFFIFLLPLLFSFPLSANAAGKIDRVLIVIDTSGSMQGEKLTVAKEASSALIKQIPESLDIGIISFDNEVKVLQEPTRDKAAAQAAVANLVAFGYTSLYDGINKALLLTTPESTTKILVVSDGNDTKSFSSLLNTFNLIDEKATPITILSLNKSPDTNAILKQIAERSAGDFILLNSISELPNFFENFGNVVKKVYAADIFNIIPAQSYENQKSKIFVPVILILLVGIILVSGIRYIYKNRIIGMRREKILRKYDLNQLGMTEVDLASIRKRLFYSKIITRYLRVQQEKLDLAGVTNQVERWTVGVLFILMFLITFTLNLFGNIFLSFVISIALILVLRNVVLNYLINKKVHDFEESLPEALLIMASGLRSGLNLIQTLESIANDANNEVARQFRRVMAELQIGTNLETALEKVANRMKSADLRWTVSALAIQREVGGNLSDILTTAANTIKGRGEIRREVRTLSAEGRTSAYVLVSLPIGILIMTLISQPNYFKVMFSNFVGVALLLVLVTLMSLGWIWVKKVVNIKI